MPEISLNLNYQFIVCVKFWNNSHFLLYFSRTIAKFGQISGQFYDHIVNYEKTHRNEVQRPIPFDAVFNSLQHIKKPKITESYVVTISSIYDLKSISRTPVADLGSETPLKKFLIRDYISIQSFKRIRENFFLKKNWFSGYLLLSTIATYNDRILNIHILFLA